jgi:hypothetical protein
VNATKKLVNILTLGMGLVPGLFYLIAIGMLFSVFGALIYDLPERISKPVLGLSAVVLVGSLQETIELILINHPALDNASGCLNPLLQVD